MTDKDGGVGMDEMELTVELLPVDIDVRPGGMINPINLSGGGVIQVAILSTAAFDATTIDLATLRLGDGADPATPVSMRPNGTYEAHERDADGDGLPDLVVHVRVDELVANGDLTGTSAGLAVRGFLMNGCTNFYGDDAIRIVP